MRISVAMLCFVFFLTACGGENPTTPPVGTTAPAGATAVRAASPEATSNPVVPPVTANPAAIERVGPITIRDQRGKTVTFDRPVARVVTIPIPAASLFMAVDGSAERIVGMNPSSARAIQGEVLGEIFPNAKAITGAVASETFAPNVEAILALRPDVVIQWGDRGDDIIAPLENVGIKVIGLKYGTQADLEAWITIFGDLVGKPERAARIVAWQRAQREEVVRLIPAGAAKPKILSFNRANPDLRVNGANTYNDEYIRLVGGENPAASLRDIMSTNAEQVLAWNPDIMILGNFDEATPADIYANPLWKDVSAVKNRRVYKIPLGGYRWDPPNQESPLMWRWLAHVAHPETPMPDVRAEIRKAYALLYNYMPTDAQLDRILQLKVNEGAAGYDRFAKR